MVLSFNEFQWIGTYFRSSEALAWIKGVSTECPNTAPSKPWEKTTTTYFINSYRQGDKSILFWYWPECIYRKEFQKLSQWNICLLGSVCLGWCKTGLLDPAADQLINTEILFLLPSGSGFVCDTKAKRTKPQDFVTVDIWFYKWSTWSVYLY